MAGLLAHGLTLRPPSRPCGQWHVGVIHRLQLRGQPWLGTGYGAFHVPFSSSRVARAGTIGGHLTRRQREMTEPGAEAGLKVKTLRRSVSAYRQSKRLRSCAAYCVPPTL